MGLGPETLVGGACDDTTFCKAAGKTVEPIGTVDVVDITLGGGIEGGGMVVIVVEGTELPTTFWDTAEIGVELSKGCLNVAGGVLVTAAAAVVATVDSGLLDVNGAFCATVVTIDCGFDNAGNGGLFTVSKLGRLPPAENGGKEKDRGFLSKEKLA